MDSDRHRSHSRKRARRDEGWLVEGSSRGETPHPSHARRRRRRRHRPRDAAELFEHEEAPHDPKEEFSLALVVLLAVGLVVALCLAYVFKSVESAPQF